jgi:anti-sigma regulatory factor (Ser/Thr protein kinase)
MDEHVTLPDGPEGASIARRATARAAELWRLDRELTETALLLVSELVTNAIRHGAPPIRLSLHLDKARGGGALRVEVSDSSPASPTVGAANPDQTNGRGMMIVQQLAARWGSHVPASRLGKTVWFELRK